MTVHFVGAGPGAPDLITVRGLKIIERFGEYPAPEFIYGYVWADVDRTREMGLALATAVDVRADVTRWLFGERLPDWDLGIMVVSELHSATEALWHGWDKGHPRRLRLKSE